jgi:hypothetical protein
MKLIDFVNEHGLSGLAELNIGMTRHPSLPLICLKYDMLDSPRFNDIVMECRGTVIEELGGVATEPYYRVVARPFTRFFNLEEGDHHKVFDWSNFHMVEKLDGSLIILYNYRDEWHANTSGSFALGKVNESSVSWRELFWQTSKLDTSKLNPSYTYLFEMWTPENMVVRCYPAPFAALIGMIRTVDGYELSEDWLNKAAVELNVPTPKRWYHEGYDKDMARKVIFSQLHMMCSEAADYEGFVLRDYNDLRLKIKGDGYLAMHRLSGNGNIFLSRNLVPIVLAGEESEAIAVLKRNNPALAIAIAETKAKVDECWTSLLALWQAARHITNQKEFALAIVKKHKLVHLLFAARKMGLDDKGLRRLFIDDAENVAEAL